MAHHPPLSHVLAPVSLSSHCLPTPLSPALHRPRSLCSHVWIISCQIFDLPELSSPHPPRNFQSPLVQLECPLLLCIHQAEFKWPVLEAVSAHYAHLYSRVSLLYHQILNIYGVSWAMNTWSGLAFHLDNQIWGTSLPPTPAPSVLSLSYYSSIPYSSLHK